MIGKKYTAVENWLWGNLEPEESDSGRQTYDNMLLQADGRLPVINVPLNLRDPLHFADEAMIQEFVAQLKDVREVLDIGPGDGWPSLRIAPYVRMVTGIDPSERRVEVCRANAERLRIENAKFQKMSVVELNFADASYDAVLAATSIEQTPDPMRAMEQVFRVLRPGGRFCVKFESFDVALSEPLSETVALREHVDGSFGWHYCLKHKDPPWERDYLVKFNPVPEVMQVFEKARALVAQAGDNPTQVREIGVEFLDANRSLIIESSYYELEHFTTRSMIETLEDVGFVNVQVNYSGAELARLAFPQLKLDGLSDELLQELSRTIGCVAAALPAPLDLGQPVLAFKPAAE